MKKILSLLFLVVLLISCSNITKMTPGTYTGQAKGRKGLVTVEVTVDETSILDVKVLSHRETPVLSDESMVKLPADMVTYQTLKVDSCSGASYTGYAIKSATENALEKAGGDVEDFKAPAAYEEIENHTEEITADYAIVGAGLAGLMSAFEAAEAGYEVVVFEKMSFVGGAMHCAAGVVAGAGSSIYEGAPEGKYSSPEAYAEDRWLKQNILQDNPEPWTEETTPMSYLMHSKNLEMTNDLIDRGVKFARPVRSVSHVLEGGYFKNTSAFAGWMEEAAEKAGVTIIKSTEVTEITSENGIVTGLKAVNGNKSYEVKAKGVLIAAGGWNSNKQMVEDNFPQYAGAESSSFPTADGASIRLASQAGGTTTGMDLGFSQLWITAKSHIEVPFFSFFNKSILVNAHGERFANEYTSYRDHGDLLLTDESHGGYAYFVWDEKENEIIENGSEKLQANPTLGQGMIGTGYKSLYELGDVMPFPDADTAASGLGLPALADEITAYNASIEAGEPDEFGRYQPYRQPLEGKIYVMKILPSIYVSYGGVSVDMNMRVLDNTGQPIKGLYAAGDAIGSPERQEGMKYTAGVTVAMSFGKLAAQTFAADFQ